MQHLPDIENTDSKKNSAETGQYIKANKKYVIFKTDTDNLNISVYRYQNKAHLKENEIYLKLTEYQSRLANWFLLLSYFEISFKRCIVLDETTAHK